MRFDDSRSVFVQMFIVWLCYF